MKTIQQQCTEKVYTLLPELKELKFSCQIALEPYEIEKLSIQCIKPILLNITK